VFPKEQTSVLTSLLLSSGKDHIFKSLSRCSSVCNVAMKTTDDKQR